eukprot:9481595-Pyramimonas_sp.AAC.2
MRRAVVRMLSVHCPYGCAGVHHLERHLLGGHGASGRGGGVNIITPSGGGEVALHSPRVSRKQPFDARPTPMTGGGSVSAHLRAPRHRMGFQGGSLATGSSAARLYL